MNDDTLIGRTSDGRYWYFMRQHRILKEPEAKPGKKPPPFVTPISADTIRVQILRLQFVDRIGCVKFFEVV